MDKNNDPNVFTPKAKMPGELSLLHIFLAGWNTKQPWPRSARVTAWVLGILLTAIFLFFLYIDVYKRQQFCKDASSGNYFNDESSKCRIFFNL